MEFVTEQDRIFSNESELCTKEKIKTIVYDIPQRVSLVAAQRIQEVIQ